MKVDMSPEAVTKRMEELDQLWELTIALQSSEIIKDEREKQNNKNSEGEFTMRPTTLHR